MQYFMLLYNILVTQKCVNTVIDKISDFVLYQFYCEVKKKRNINLCEEIIFICDL